MSTRAWILLPSGRRPDSLAPDPAAWTDRDVAMGLRRTCRWAGYSAWDLLLSVAQHSLTMLGLCDAAPDPRLAAVQVRRVLMHDAVEALIAGWDSITPPKPHLGKGFAEKNRVLSWLRGLCPSAGYIAARCDSTARIPPPCCASCDAMGRMTGQGTCRMGASAARVRRVRSRRGQMPRRPCPGRPRTVQRTSMTVSSDAIREG